MNGNWGASTNLGHPATFETIEMEPGLMRMIVEELDGIVRRELYKKVVKAWKRGYLLYGPPGTGKSSLIGATANYLKFDVYDLELSSMHIDLELKNILLSTKHCSILVVEDIDCSIDMQNQESEEQTEEPTTKLTVSGLLNFIDGHYIREQLQSKLIDLSYFFPSKYPCFLVIFPYNINIQLFIKIHNGSVRRRELKRVIVEDLERFVRRREFYMKVGKAWKRGYLRSSWGFVRRKELFKKVGKACKRGYLLHGPPGTENRANCLKFDVSDLKLTSNNLHEHDHHNLQE
ncbi:hypothetical protein EV2_018854 [Malus domestica]